MKPIRTFTVTPSLPAPLHGLREIAYNLRWSWNHDAIALFRRLDSDLWETTGHNPVLMLGTIDQAQLEAAAIDEGFLTHLERVSDDLKAYLDDKSTWFHRNHEAAPEPLVAYFSAEFGLTDCLSIFAGGLGLLAGDHLKSASDLGVPLVGVGLLYQQGYFRQYLNEAGWQQEAYEDNDFHNLPLNLERHADGTQLTIQVEYPDRPVVAQIWRAQVGRVALYLLDTNVAANRPEDRIITNQLYGGDLEMRVRQEIMLGIGGYRTLAALNIEPHIYHMNEGHSAFLALERVRCLMSRHGLSFAQAREAASAGLVFTTHTPVPAGQDYFPPALMDRYFSDYTRQLGLSRHEFLALGRQNADDEGEAFGMPVLALHLSAYSNGVSRLHGQVSRRMWQGMWPGVPEDDIPISHVTNGVHFRSWISHEMDQLYDRYLGLRWREEPADQAVWQRAERIPAEELWRTHELRRERLVAFVRRRLHRQLEQVGKSSVELESVDELLNPDVLTIGFARRFATYKRATLLFQDPERLARILNNSERPVQIIVAGKAHPRDDAGKELIRQIVTLSRREEFQHRLVFLENYDVAVARYLVQGVDVWLNTPRRLQEASGTSGMKAAANGVLNLSTLDGWWDEAWSQTVPECEAIGWAIGRGESYQNTDEQDRIEAEALYNLLEQDIVPTFYERDTAGLPRQWIARMKASMGTLNHFFNTHRMVQDYTQRFYLPASLRYEQLTNDGMSLVKALASWKDRIHAGWREVSVAVVDVAPPSELQVEGKLRTTAKVHLGKLNPDDVRVELYLGRVDANGEIIQATAIPMQRIESNEQGDYFFETDAIPCHRSGLHGYTLRVLPQHTALNSSFLPGLIDWAEDNPDVTGH